MLKIFLTFVAALFSALPVLPQTSELNIIPQPNSVSRIKGEFKLNYQTKIVATDETGCKSAGILNDLLMKNYGFKLEFTGKPQMKNAIVFLQPTLPIQHAQVENVIRRLKIFRILSERYRHRRKRFGLRFNLIAGLHNELKLKP